MAFPLPVTAAQVGTYFVGQYYRMLQNQPDCLHQFYSDASTMLRIDGNARASATAMLQIHQLVTSLNYTGLKIKTAHSLESWNGGVLVMVSGSVHVKFFNARRKFVETFFLAPQENGYFVLNDIFHYVEEEQVLQLPFTYIPRTNLDAELNSPATVREQVPNYMLGKDIQLREFVAPTNIENKNNGSIDNYNYHEEQLQQVFEAETNPNDNFAVQSNHSLQRNMNSMSDDFSSSHIEDPVVESQKHTYASILQVAKAQSAQAVPSQKPELPSPSPIEKPGMETLEEASGFDDEFEVKSVYVRNVPTSMAASEIGEEFKKFGKLKPNGVAIRTRKDIDVSYCYAFVEFEDMTGVHNAIEASTVQIGAHQLYIEGRRPNRGISFHGGRARGRGRFSYPIEGSRGRFTSRGFGRASNQDF